MRGSTASGAKVLARVIAAVLMAAGLLTGVPASITDSPKEPLEYVALGDSYSAGAGAGQAGKECGVSPFGFPARLDRNKKVELTANPSCGGATTADLFPGGGRPAQVLSLDLDTDLVTVVIGGNDIGFANIVASCSVKPGSSKCDAAVREAIRGVTMELPAKLATTFGAIRTAAPDAHVVVMGYPRLLSPHFGQSESASEGAVALNNGVELLNAALESAAESAGFQYLDVTGEFRNHGVGAPQPWIHPSGPATFHPTAEGYKKGYMKAFKTEVRLNKLQQATADD
ncbi:MAG TPA: SGNH/GDSL hydrolase family protein [Arthrobacter sp.]|nr:SGNH/GDSL hydrolase family protein [Arthrobacter sp.]